VKKLILVLGFTLSGLCVAEIEIYKSTYNTGVNKLERIGVIEQYLATLSGTLQNIEAKVDATALKVSSLEKVVAQIKETDIKNIQAKLSEKDAPVKNPTSEELDKLKADFTALKNDDIEVMRTQIQGLNSSVQSIQGILQTQLK
jgi:lipopolysaccharide biosynthesis regulator YciM